MPRLLLLLPDPKKFYLNDCSYDLDSIFVKHRFPPRKSINKGLSHGIQEAELRFLTFHWDWGQTRPISMFAAIGPPRGRGRKGPTSRCGRTVSGLSVSLDEAGAVAEPVAARARQGQGLRRLLALLRRVAGEGLRARHLGRSEAVTWTRSKGQRAEEQTRGGLGIPGKPSEALGPPATGAGRMDVLTRRAETPCALLLRELRTRSGRRVPRECVWAEILDAREPGEFPRDHRLLPSATFGSGQKSFSPQKLSLVESL